MSALGQDRERIAAAERERQRIKLAYPDEFNDGAKRAFTGDKLYPQGFLKWPLQRRNAWYAGFNKGYSDRKRGRDDGR
jgi:hypothetical protein